MQTAPNYVWLEKQFEQNFELFVILVDAIIYGHSKRIILPWSQGNVQHNMFI